jgi:hypothetical protein
MRSIPVIAVDVVAGDDIKMLLIEHEHVVETFSAKGSNKSFTMVRIIQMLRCWAVFD